MTNQTKANEPDAQRPNERIVMLNDLLWYYHNEELCKEDTNEFVNRIIKYGLSVEIPAGVIANMNKWANSDAGYEAGEYYNLSFNELFGEA